MGRRNSLSWCCYYIRAAKFKCSIDQAKRSFYQAANGIFAKIGRMAAEEVMVQLLKQKCLPILLYALDVCIYMQLGQNINAIAGLNILIDFL